MAPPAFVIALAVSCNSEGKFKVTVITGDGELAGTSAQVGITVYGHRGDSGFIPLGTADGVIFQHRNVDEFEVKGFNIRVIICRSFL